MLLVDLLQEVLPGAGVVDTLVELLELLVLVRGHVGQPETDGRGAGAWSGFVGLDKAAFRACPPFHALAAREPVRARDGAPVVLAATATLHLFLRLLDAATEARVQHDAWEPGARLECPQGGAQ